MPTPLISAAGPHFNSSPWSDNHFVDYALQHPVLTHPDPIGPVSKQLDGIANLRSSLLDAVALNPQPLPPGDQVSINPQPLPPGGESSWLRAVDEFCGLGKPRPPLPLQIAEQLGLR